MQLNIMQGDGADQRAGENLHAIKDPVQQYAMHMLLTTNCTPETAAAAAVIRYRIHDPEGNLARAITVTITNELMNRKQERK